MANCYVCDKFIPDSLGYQRQCGGCSMFTCIESKCSLGCPCWTDEIKLFTTLTDLEGNEIAKFYGGVKE